MVLRSHQAYLGAGLDRHPGKGFGFSPVNHPMATEHFIAWGTEVNARLGTVGTKLSKRRSIAMLYMWAVQFRGLPRKLLQRL
eukprot:7861426-Karenia_brevis.AAC.1